MVMFVPCRKLQKEFNTLYFCNFAKNQPALRQIETLFALQSAGRENFCRFDMAVSQTPGERLNFAVTCFILFCSEVLCSQGVGPQQEENALSIWCDLWHKFVGQTNFQHGKVHRVEEEVLSIWCDPRLRVCTRGNYAAGCFRPNCRF